MVGNLAIQLASDRVDGHLRADDEALARLGRSQTRLRLRNGELLHRMKEIGGHHELGFSEIDFYGLERCGRDMRWCRDTRGLAKRLKERGLVRIREALRTGQLTWSMAELLTRHATPKDEAKLIERALTSTVREMRAWFKDPEERPESVQTARTVSIGEKLLFETTKMGIAYLNGKQPGDEATLTAMLGEAETSLYPMLAAGELIELPKIPTTERPARPEAPPPRAKPFIVAVEPDEPIPTDPNTIDALIRKTTRELAARDLEIGRVARRPMHGGWARLGYASREQYARERVGMSVSSIEHRITLYRRAARTPVLRDAFLDGSIGYEAATQIGRLGHMGSAMQAAWVERAKRRTVIALRKEVKAVLLDTSLDPDASKAPPNDDRLKEIEELERKVQSGELYRSLLDGKLDPQMSVTLLAGTGAEIRMTVSAELRNHFDRIEALFRTIAPPNASFVAFMCISFWRAWLPFFEHQDAKWKELHLRDLHRCTSPVCDRSDVTPHHLEFQAHGGGDELENMTSLCSWCHLHGIHEGRITAKPPASRVQWKIGRRPIMEIDDRDVVAR